MQRQILAVLAVVCVHVCIGSAQTPSPGATPVPPMHGEKRKASIAAALANAGANPSAVGLDQPVITLKGACEPVGGTPPSKDCVSVITRAQFEKLANALQPDMPATVKRQMATNYARLLVFADAARALHLENSPDVQQIMQFVTNQVLTEGLKRHYTEEFSHPSDQQIQAYYDQNSAKYLEATLERIIIPHAPGAEDKPKASEAEEAAAAEKIRQRWIAGEDPVKLQKDAFEAAGIQNGSTPDVNMGSKRPGSLPVNQESVFQLKAGEFSQAYSDPTAVYIYKVVAVRNIPLGEVKESITKTLQQEQLQQKLEQIGKSATPELNDEYFGPPPSANTPALPGHPTPGAPPPSGNPPK